MRFALEGNRYFGHVTRLTGSDGRRMLKHSRPWSRWIRAVDDFNGARLTAYPGSHIAEAAQQLIEWREERVVYTGDIKLHPPICGSPTEVVPYTECDGIKDVRAIYEASPPCPA